MVEKFTILELIKDYKYAILGIVLLLIAFLIWNEEEPGFSIVFGIFGFVLLVRSLGN